MGDIINNEASEKAPQRPGFFHRVVGIGLGLLLGAMAGTLVGLVAGVAMALILGLL
jgi:hypothetical protein